MTKADATRPKRAHRLARPALALGSVIVSLLALELLSFAAKLPGRENSNGTPSRRNTCR